MPDAAPAKLDPARIQKFAAESKEVISGLQKQATEQAAEIERVQKVAADKEAAEKAEKDRLAKLAQETAKDLCDQKVIAPADLQKFASGLADPDKAHNLLRTLGRKLAASESAPVLGRPQTKTASDAPVTANEVFDARLRAATGR